MLKPNIEGCGNGAPLGAEMGSSAFFHSRKKYRHNGGMAFAHHPASACQGSKMAMMAPSHRP
jgi:hypothetical protein